MRCFYPRTLAILENQKWMLWSTTNSGIFCFYPYHISALLIIVFVNFRNWSIPILVRFNNVSYIYGLDVSCSAYCFNLFFWKKTSPHEIIALLHVGFLVEYILTLSLLILHPYGTSFPSECFKHCLVIRYFIQVFVLSVLENNEMVWYAGLKNE